MCACLPPCATTARRPLSCFCGDAELSDASQYLIDLVQASPRAALERIIVATTAENNQLGVAAIESIIEVCSPQPRRASTSDMHSIERVHIPKYPLGKVGTIGSQLTPKPCFGIDE